MGGATVQLERLIALRHRACGSLLEHLQRQELPGAGNHRAKTRGRGIEFDSLRPYLPGDDLRTLDWRITARTQKPYTRLFHSEREQSVLFWIDQRPSLHFGSQHAFKSVQACETAALIAWGALEQGDRIGALCSDGAHQHWHAPQRGQKKLLPLLNELCTRHSHPAPSAPAPISEDLNRLNERARPGSTLVLLSDFQNLNQNAQVAIQALTCHHTVIALPIYDPLECKPPPSGRYWLEQSGVRKMLDCTQRRLRQQYADTGKARLDQIHQTLSACRARVHLLTTQTPIEEQIPWRSGGQS